MVQSHWRSDPVRNERCAPNRVGASSAQAVVDANAAAGKMTRFLLHAKVQCKKARKKIAIHV